MKKLTLIIIIALFAITGFSQKRGNDISIDRYYTIKQGNLHFHATRVFFTNGIFFDQTETDTIRFYNASNKPITITFEDLPEFLKCEALPKVVKANEEGNIAISYNSKIKNVYGPTFDYFYAITDDVERPKKRLIVSPDIYEDFSSLSKREIKNSPKIKVDKKKIDLGTLVEGEEVLHVFNIKNEGKRDLIIRATKASCGCTATDITNKVIKAGEEAEMEVIFRSIGKNGKQKHSITVVSNDINDPVVMLSLTGNVIKAEKQ